MNALDLFRLGHDYVEIANVLGTTEAEVEKAIHKLRAQATELERRRTYRREYMRQRRAEELA